MRNTTLKNTLLAIGLTFFFTVVYAANLGNITVISAQGQPFNAEVALFPTDQEDLTAITARLASPEVFAEQGLVMAPELASVRAIVAIRADGQPVVQLFSSEPIKTSALDILLQVDSTVGGSLVRKYALVLEAAPAPAAPAEIALPAAKEAAAPTEAPAVSVVKEPVVAEPAPVPEEKMAEAPTAEATTLEQPEHEATLEEMTADVTGIEAPDDEPDSEFDENADLTKYESQEELTQSPLGDSEETAKDENSPSVEQSAQEATTGDKEVADATLPGETDAKQEKSTAVDAVSSEAEKSESPVTVSSYTVEKGDTLRKIATQQWHEDVSLEQMMAGLYRANPQAFVKGDPNRLKEGQILRVPSAEELKAINQAEAASVVHAKNWNVYRNKLSETVAKAAPVKESESSPVASGKIATVHDQAEAAHGPRDVVKLSGDAGKGTGSKLSKSALQEELTARENALKESIERIALLEKQLADANKLLQAQKQAADATAAEAAEKAKAKSAEAAKAEQGGITTLQDSLQKDPSLKAKGLGVLAILAALFLFLRSRGKNSGGTEPKKPDAPATEVGGEALTGSSALNQEESDKAAAEKAEADLAVGAAIGAALAAQAEEAKPEEIAEPPAQVSAEQFATAEESLNLEDLLPEPQPEETEVPQDIAAESAPVAASEVTTEEPSADELIADMMAASDAVEAAEAVKETEPLPVPSEPEAKAGDAFDDIFDSSAALADLVAETSQATPVVEDQAAAEVADEAATDAMTAAAMEEGNVEAEDQFSLDDVFGEAQAAADAVPTLPAKESAPVSSIAELAADDFDDIFDSESALAELVAEMPANAEGVVEDEAAAAIADEAATDTKTAAAMEEGSIEAEDQFSLDDVFGEAQAASAVDPEVAPLALEPETITEPEIAVESTIAVEPAVESDHSAALAAAFEETAKEDLSGLDFGFDLEDTEDQAAPEEPVPVAKTKAKAKTVSKTKSTSKKATETKKPAKEPEVKLDLSSINLDVTGEIGAAESAEVDTKLDLVSAYIDMSDEDGARELLQEVIKEGSLAQVAKAKKILDGLS